MPGTFVFKPIEANLTRSTDFVGKMSPYCAFTVNGIKFKGPVSKKGGKNPHWNDVITLPASNQPQMLVELLDKDKFTRDDNIGSFLVDLQEVKSTGHINKWYPLYHNSKPVGEILLESVFQSDSSLGSKGQIFQEQPAPSSYVNQQTYQSGAAQSGYAYQQGYQSSAQAGSLQSGYAYQQGYQSGVQVGSIQQGTTTGTTALTSGSIIEQQFQKPINVFTEKKQVVEPHRFTKQINVTETVPVLQEVQVMEPVRVVRDVVLTRAVPVTKQIEVSEPEIVVKEIEVLEPVIVTKTIQVVENVPVKKLIEVVELTNTVHEVQDYEQQTFTRQVEVTEYVPQMRQVEISEPVTLKKEVEYVEPVITTQTITKEIPQTVIVDEKITREVGPASVIGMETEIRDYGYVEKFNEIRISGQEQIVEKDYGIHQIAEHHMPLQQHYHSNQVHDSTANSSTFKREIDELGTRIKNTFPGKH